MTGPFVGAFVVAVLALSRSTFWRNRSREHRRNDAIEQATKLRGFLDLLSSVDPLRLPKRAPEAKLRAEHEIDELMEVITSTWDRVPPETKATTSQGPKEAKEESAEKVITSVDEEVEEAESEQVENYNYKRAIAGLAAILVLLAFFQLGAGIDDSEEFSFKELGNFIQSEPFAYMILTLPLAVPAAYIFSRAIVRPIIKKIYKKLRRTKSNR